MFPTCLVPGWTEAEVLSWQSALPFLNAGCAGRCTSNLICAALSRGKARPRPQVLQSSSPQSHSAALAGKTALALQRLLVQPCWPGLPRDLHTSSSAVTPKLCPSQIRGVNQEQIITVRQWSDQRNRGMGVPWISVLNHTCTKLGWFRSG